MSSCLYLLATQNTFEIMWFFANLIARTYFNQHHYNFIISNPCRRLPPLLGLSSDEHRYYIYIYIYIYSHVFLSDIQDPCPFKFYSHHMALIVTQFMYLLLQSIKMIFRTNISATYMDRICDALVAWKKYLQTVSLNWVFCAALVRGTSGA